MEFKIFYGVPPARDFAFGKTRKKRPTGRSLFADADALYPSRIASNAAACIKRQRGVQCGYSVTKRRRRKQRKINPAPD